MKCPKHKGCEAYWDEDGRLQHTNAPASATKPRRARKRAAGGRSRGAAKTTEAQTRTTTPATQTTHVTPES